MEEELVGENEISRFYRSSMTKTITSYGSPIGLQCVIAERKDDSKKEYILLNRKNEPIKADSNAETILYYIDVKKRLTKR